MTELKYEITKLDAKIENMEDRIEKMALHDKREVGIEFLTSTVKYFKELRRYLRAEEQGLLLRLPCKAGSTVYKIITQRDNFDDRAYKIVSAIEFRVSMIEEIGKTVFLTQTEAEQKLKEMESERKC